MRLDSGLRRAVPAEHLRVGRGPGRVGDANQRRGGGLRAGKAECRPEPGQGKGAHLPGCGVFAALLESPGGRWACGRIRRGSCHLLSTRSAMLGEAVGDLTMSGRHAGRQGQSLRIDGIGS